MQEKSALTVSLWALMVWHLHAEVFLGLERVSNLSLLSIQTIHNLTSLPKLSQTEIRLIENWHPHRVLNPHLYEGFVPEVNLVTRYVVSNGRRKAGDDIY